MVGTLFRHTRKMLFLHPKKGGEVAQIGEAGGGGVGEGPPLLLFELLIGFIVGVFEFFIQVFERFDLIEKANTHIYKYK